MLCCLGGDYVESLYRKLYFKLFGILADAIELLENGNVWEAKQLLIKTQREAEEFYIENADDREEI